MTQLKYAAGILVGVVLVGYGIFSRDAAVMAMGAGAFGIPALVPDQGVPSVATADDLTERPDATQDEVALPAETPAQEAQEEDQFDDDEDF